MSWLICEQTRTAPDGVSGSAVTNWIADYEFEMVMSGVDTVEVSSGWTEDARYDILCHDIRHIAREPRNRGPRRVGECPTRRRSDSSHF